MTGLWITLAVFAVCIAIGMTKIRVLVELQSTVTVRLAVGWISVRIFPSRKKRKTKSLKKTENNPANHKGAEEKKSSKQANLSPKQICTLIRRVKPLLERLFARIFGYIRLYRAELSVRVATDDAASTAIAYGSVVQAVSYLEAWLCQIDRWSARTKRAFSVRCDFTGSKSQVNGRIGVYLRVWQLPVIGMQAFLSFLKIREIQKLQQTQKNENNIAKQEELTHDGQ